MFYLVVIECYDQNWKQIKICVCYSCVYMVIVFIWEEFSVDEFEIIYDKDIINRFYIYFFVQFLKY